MCNTVPKVIGNLGYEYPDGFTKKEFIAAFLQDGYGIKKIERHWAMCVLSKMIIPNPLNTEGGPDTFISSYCPAHYMNFREYLEDVEIIPYKIDRDGRPIRINC